MTATYDVVIIGAGPAGSACAAHCARAGLATALVERTSFDDERIGETLAPSVHPHLRQLGVWEDFLGLRPIPSWDTRSAWGAAAPTTQSHLLSPYGCAWHVDRRAVDALLAHRAAAAGAALHQEASVRTCTWNGTRWEVLLSTGQVQEARFVVDGTGRGARLSRMLGARRIALDRLVAVAASVGLPHLDGEGYLFIETAPDGWWYSAPLPTGRLMVMLLTDADLCRSARSTDPARWRAAIPPATRRRARGAEDARPAVHRATSQRLRRADSLPWLAVGDAALAVDPASGTGFVRALRTAASASSAVRSYLADGSVSALAAYESDRDSECTEYLEGRAEVYAGEARWSTPFWRRRAAAVQRWTCSRRAASEMEPETEG